MAKIMYTGNAAAVAQVDTFTPANVEIGDVFTLTATGLDNTTCAISFTATATTAANVAAGLIAAWNLSANALCTPITASGTDTVILTADVAGDAFSVAATAVNGSSTDDQTLSRAATVASAGPKHWDSAANWSGGAVPGEAASQDVYIEDHAGDLLYGLDQSGASEALASLNIGQSYTGRIGYEGAGGMASTYLQIKTAILRVGYHNSSGSPAGSGRIKIDLGSTACEATISNTGTPTDSTVPSVCLLADSASTTVTAVKGKVGIAVASDETSTIGQLTVMYASAIASDAEVYVGEGVTLTTLVQTGGNCSLNSAATTVTATAGTLTIAGSGAYTTLNNEGATVNSKSSGAIATVNQTGGTTYSDGAGTITAANIRGGTFDATRDRTARTITTLKLDPPAVFRYDPAIVTLTNKIQPYSAAGKMSFTVAAA